MLVSQSENDIFIEWSDGEKSEYDALEQQARDFFNQLSRKVGSQLSSHYLKLQRGLTTLRIACSGGHIPLPDGDNDPSTENDTNAADEEEKKPKGKKIVRYSDFCYTSKMEKLIEELVRIRDEDPSGTIIVD
jgi:hypothetical protein